VRLLLARGADPSARSGGGDTPVSLATSMGASRALRALTVSG
jgi:hypothetical protein